MKRFSPYIVIIYAMTCLVACQDNFDEVADTNLRHVSINIDATHLFDSLIQPTADGQVRYGETLPDDYQLRLTALCYDSEDSLVALQTLLVDDISTHQITLHRLQGTENHHLDLIVDAVRKDDILEYIETWYLLNTARHTTTHIVATSLNDDAVKNVVAHACADFVPANQTLTIVPAPVTYCGYLKLINTGGCYLLTAKASGSDDLLVDGMLSMHRSIQSHRMDFPDGTVVMWPFTFTHGDNALDISLEVTDSEGQRQAAFCIPNSLFRHFIITIDCHTMQMDDTQYF